MGFNTGMSEDDVEELRREYELELGGLEKELATLRAQLEAEKALSDRLHHDASSVYGIQPETGAAYRTARGL